MMTLFPMELNLIMKQSKKLFLEYQPVYYIYQQKISFIEILNWKMFY